MLASFSFSGRQSSSLAIMKGNIKSYKTLLKCPLPPFKIFLSLNGRQTNYIHIAVITFIVVGMPASPLNYKQLERETMFSSLYPSNYHSVKINWGSNVYWIIHVVSLFPPHILEGFFRAVVLKLEHASTASSPARLAKKYPQTPSWVSELGGLSGAQEFAFLTNFHMMLMVRNHTCRTTDLEHHWKQK